MLPIAIAFFHSFFFDIRTWRAKRGPMSCFSRCVCSATTTSIRIVDLLVTLPHILTAFCPWIARIYFLFSIHVCLCLLLDVQSSLCWLVSTSISIIFIVFLIITRLCFDALLRPHFLPFFLCSKFVSRLHSLWSSNLTSTTAATITTATGTRFRHTQSTWNLAMTLASWPVLLSALCVCVR